MRPAAAQSIIQAAKRIASAAALPAPSTPDKTGILLVSFGTSAPKAAKRLLDTEAAIRTAFPDIPIHWGYTSHIVRAKLEARGNLLPAAPTTLADMYAAGFTRVAVQPLYLIEGEEFDKLVALVQDFQSYGHFSALTLGRPLLSTGPDLAQVASTVLSHIPPTRQPHEAVIFMGHGTLHSGHATYDRLRTIMQQHDPNTFLGTIEGQPDFSSIIAELHTRNFKRAWLMPLLAMAGDHVLNDMAGDEPDSWKSRLITAGIEPLPVLTGALEYDGIVNVWIEHLRNALADMHV